MHPTLGRATITYMYMYMQYVCSKSNSALWSMASYKYMPMTSTLRRVLLDVIPGNILACLKIHVLIITETTCVDIFMSLRTVP